MYLFSSTFWHNYFNPFNRLTKTTRQLEEERHMNKSLCQNQAEWQAKVEKSQKEMEETQVQKDKEIKELQVNWKLVKTIWAPSYRRSPRP